VLQSKGQRQETAIELERVFGRPFRGPVVLVPESRHYSWDKGVSSMGLGRDALRKVELDASGKLSIESLKKQIARARREDRPILMVVSVAGSTELGTVDPIDRIQDVLDRQAIEEGVFIWHHVDAAFGGFFCSLGGAAERLLGHAVSRGLGAVCRATSITLDPHKLGYVPYASGAFLAGRERDYRLTALGAPYVQFDYSSDKGPYTLEGSRSAAGASATWLTEKSIGFAPDGYGRILARTIRIKRELEAELASMDERIRIAPGTDLNILCFTVAERGWSLSNANRAARRIFRALSPVAGGPFVVSKTELKRDAYGALIRELGSRWGADERAEDLVLIRLCLMNPFFDSREMRTCFTTRFLDVIANLIRHDSLSEERDEE
jgi:glutamate/tyrosine decarboxylase-like PLP-dependent enzyme